MTRTAARFTQADLTKAAKAMIAAGCKVSGARIDREGNIEVLCAPQPSEQTAEPTPLLPKSLGEWRKDPRHGAR